MLSLFIALEIIGPCSEKPLQSVNLLEGMNVGEATVRTFWSKRIPFQGTDRAINTIMGIPKKDETLEVISDTDMRAYGWCFDVDGEVPEEYADQIPLHEGMKKIRWFHGYAEMKGGQWVSQCQETAKLKPAFLCH
ncbi:MAG: hypothetical protein V4598_03165 [Bdellovibrionota bacterium]